LKVPSAGRIVRTSVPLAFITSISVGGMPPFVAAPTTREKTIYFPSADQLGRTSAAGVRESRRRCVPLAFIT